MLLEFGAKNYYSFKEGFDVSLRLGKTCPKEISQGKAYTRILAVKGANASGKTNVFKLISFLTRLATESFTAEQGEELDLHTYFSNEDPTEAYMVLAKNGIEYTYEVKASTKEIISEVIYKKDKKKVPIIERTYNKISYLTKEYEELSVIKLKANSSIISTAKQYGLDSINNIYSLFSNIITNVHVLGRNDQLPDYQIVSKFYHDNPKVFQFVVEVLKRSDTGIDDIEIKQRKDTETGKTVFFPIFLYNVTEKENFLTFFDQSSGVKALYQQLGLYAIVLSSGGILALDEFDTYLHPDLLPMLIDFFENEKINEHDAQLIFTTHDATIMDALGKYRIILVNKEDNESFLYRLDEIPGDLLRNDRSLTQKYNAGKIGGKPRISHG